MSQTPHKAADFVFDGPDADDNDKQRILRVDIAKAFNFHDGADGGDEWEKVKNLTRNDLWALSGFGTTTAFDGWTVEELTRLGNALGAHIGKPYGKAMYVCCTCC